MAWSAKGRSLTLCTIDVANAVKVARVVVKCHSPSVRRVLVFVEFGDAGVCEYEAPLICVAEIQQVGEDGLQRSPVADDQDVCVLLLVGVDDLVDTYADSVPRV